jgi:hypothetical protein
MKFAKGHTKLGGRKKGAGNKRAVDQPDALRHLALAMADESLGPELRLRAAAALARFQCPVPSMPRTPALNPTPIDVEAPQTIEETRALAARLAVDILAGRLDIDAGNAALALLRGIETSIVNVDLKAALDDLMARLPELPE